MALSKSYLKNYLYDGSGGILTKKYKKEEKAQVSIDWGTGIGDYMGGMVMSSLSQAQKSAVKTATIAALLPMTSTATIVDFSGILTAGLVAAAATVALQSTNPPARVIIPPVTPPTPALISFFTAQMATAGDSDDETIALKAIAQGLSDIIDTWARTGSWATPFSGGPWL